MSQLIQMNQRINAIETIKKITHATRLIAMSAHTRLANKEPLLTNYKNEISKLFSQLTSCIENIQEPLFNQQANASGSLIILIGSQKGFCGTFNITLFKFFELKFPHLSENDTIIAVGRKASDYLRKKKIEPLETFNNLSSSTLDNITDLLTSLINKEMPSYKNVFIISSQATSFFLQKPHLAQIFPVKPQEKDENCSLDTYIWPEQPEIIIHSIGQLYIDVTLKAILFSSLVAEQAARFHSMDSATRNAEDLLDVMRRDYNKLRQTKITKELIELASSFER